MYYLKPHLLRLAFDMFDRRVSLQRFRIAIEFVSLEGGSQRASISK